MKQKTKKENDNEYNIHKYNRKSKSGEDRKVTNNKKEICVDNENMPT